MNPSIKITLCLGASLLTMLCRPVSSEAGIIGYDSFFYKGSTVAGADGGTFWDFKNTGGTGPAAHTTKASDWDPAPGFSGVSAFSGDQLFTGDSGLIREYGGPDTAGETAGAINETNTAKKVYYRVTMTRGADTTWCGVSSFDFGTEQLFFGLYPDNSGKFTIYNQSNFSRLALSTTDVTVGQTYTLVAKLDFANNGVALYVNPNFNTPESFNTPVCSAVYTATNWSTALRLASGGAGLAAWDDLTVATTWENLRTFPVTNTNDQGAGSLRQALADANTNTGGRITFAPDPSPRRIVLSNMGSGLGDLFPVPDATVIIDGPETGAGVTLDGAGGTRILSLGILSTCAVRNLTFTQARVPEPFSNSGGGAVSTSGYFSAERCTFVNNFSRSSGGAIWASAGGLKLNRCTFTGNAAQVGGALAIGSGNATLLHSTFSGNQATGTSATLHGGGGLSLESGTTAMTGCVIAGNTASTPNGPDFWNSSAATAEGCVIGNGTASNLTATTANGNAIGTTGTPVKALLAGLGQYGGTTPTMPPLPGSPAIDRTRTHASSGDQRGFLINGFPDAGAADYRGTPDLLLYWPTDWDQDGTSYGVEQATGTDPLKATPNPLTITLDSAGNPVITFPRDATGAFRTRWLLKSSPNLMAPWTTVWSLNGVTSVEITNSGYTSNTWPNIPAGPGGFPPAFTGTGRAVTAVPPYAARNFYRLEAELIP